MNKAKRTAVLLMGTLFCSAAVFVSWENTTFLPVCASPSEQGGEQSGTEQKIALSSPEKDEEGNMLWDMVYFGNYWQNDTNQSGMAERTDEKEPILWRVLSVTEDQKAILQSEYCLEKRSYNESNTDVNWGTCTLRSWLNGYGSGENKDQIDYREDNFINEAFSEAEQELLVPVSLQTQKNPRYGTDCGEDTVDKIYLLACEDLKNEAYGFNIDKYHNYANYTKATEYCQDSRGLQYISDSGSVWWTRTSGKTNKKAMRGVLGGFFSLDEQGEEVWFYQGVRPVVCIDLKRADTDFIKYAGKISSGLVKTTRPADKTRMPAMPVKEEYSTTWDCINFGAYYQNDTNGDGKIDESDKMEPIKWRVLDISEDGKTVTLLSDKNLDKMRFNETSAEISWGTSVCRSWLNGYDGQHNADGADYSGQGFYNIAFSEKEQEAIVETTLADAGTTDKVYLLSMNDVTGKKYGLKWGNSRIAENTAYADVKFGGTKGWTTGDWFLRDITDCNKWPATVSDTAMILEAVLGRHLCAVRPALRLNLELAAVDNGSLLWEYAGTVTTRGKGPFFVTSPADAQPQKGDIDADGEITLKDAQLALKAALNLIVISEEQKQAADLSGDGEVTLKDAQTILKMALNLVES